jgi:hypothetical protein
MGALEREETHVVFWQGNLKVKHHWEVLGVNAKTVKLYLKQHTKVWLDQVQYRKNSGAGVSTAMNPNFLSSWGTVSFSIRTLLHVVISYCFVMNIIRKMEHSTAET